MSFLTISIENIFLKNQDTRLGVIVVCSNGLEQLLTLMFLFFLLLTVYVKYSLQLRSQPHQ